MAAPGPLPPRHRPRRGSIERPVSGRVYRGTWLLIALPLLVAAFTVARPAPLPAPALPPAFDEAGARLLAGELATRYPDRTPGSAGALGASQWVAAQLKLYGLPVTTDSFEQTVAGVGRRQLQNVSAVIGGQAGQAPQTIVVMAHRDDRGAGPGADDNASGTAALIELARAYAAPPSGTNARPVTAAHRIVFLSTDGGNYGGLGARHFIDTSGYRRDVVAVVNLDAIAGPGRPRLEIAGDAPRSPAASLVRTAAARIADESGAGPRRPSGLAQLIDLAFPFSLYEQAPFVGRGIPAVTITTAGDRPPAAFTDVPERLRTRRLGVVGRAAQDLLGSLDQGLELAQGTTSYVWLGDRMVRGWAIELVLISALLPFVVAAVDLFARCRRRHIALAPAFRAYRSRIAFWLVGGALFELFALAGAWPRGAAAPLSPDTAAARHWPMAALAGLAVLLGLAWLVARARLLPRRPVTPSEELAGHTAALVALGVVALLVVAINPFALVFVLPSLHAWLWLPQWRGRPWAQTLLLLLGLAGPGLLLWSLGTRFGLGWDAPWYLASLVSIGYVGLGPLVVFLAWAAGGAQLAALTAGRYAPYPDADERGPRGPIRETVRTIVLAVRR
ncbi:MAG TPA: M28 family peptidase, partial [Gaiellaceae bacterium]|nr:M28 family peptidase [Gaiellaceae bacterium]